MTEYVQDELPFDPPLPRAREPKKAIAKFTLVYTLDGVFAYREDPGDEYVYERPAEKVDISRACREMIDAIAREDVVHTVNVQTEATNKGILEALRERGIAPHTH